MNLECQTAVKQKYLYDSERMISVTFKVLMEDLNILAFCKVLMEVKVLQVHTKYKLPQKGS